MTLLAEWQLTCGFFDGDWLKGPVPRLFAPDPDVARAALDRDPLKAFKDIQRIHSRIPILSTCRRRKRGQPQVPITSKVKIKFYFVITSTN
jgi:hypothetical protein